MANPAVYQVVVADGLIVGTHDTTDDIYDLYDHGTHAWFDYVEPIPIFEEVELDEDVLTGDTTPEINVVTVGYVVPAVAVPDPRLTMSLANAKLAVISQLNRIATHLIEADYPLQTQQDIIRLATPWIAQDRTDMYAAIDAIRADLIAKTAAVNALGTVNLVIAYDVWD